MTTRVLIAALLCFAALPPAGAASVDVYIGTYTSGSSSEGIYRSVLDLETGALSQPVLAAKAKDPSFVEIYPGGKYLYAVSEVGEGTVSTFSIDADSGGLTLLNTRSSGGAAPCHISIDHAGRNLLAANYSSGTASVHPILPDGRLGEASATVRHEGSGPNRRRQQEPHAHSINVSGDDRFAYVADLGIDKIMIYRLDVEKGTLAANDPAFAKTAPGAGPRHFAFSPEGEYAYAVNELDCTVAVFARDPASGALTPKQAITTLPTGFKGSNSCAEIRVHPSGRFVYASNRGHDSIAVYKVSPDDGTLAFVEHETAEIKTPRNFNIDPTGRFCLVANQGGDSVIVFTIDPSNGTLEPTGHKVAVGKPVCIRFARRKNDVAANILIAYYSRTGNTEKMAAGVAEGAAGVPGVTAVVKKVGEASKADLEAADGIILGAPTYFANVPGEMKTIIDDWNWKLKVDFTDKVGGAFATAGGQVGGQGHVVTSLLLFMLNNRMVVAGPLYRNETTGSIWGEPGAAAITGPLDAGVGEGELAGARRLGARVASLAAKMKACREL
ncbi:MAG: beta-propeller fold lactonase family protein [Sedimentisphaerales bacterium]|nr:beta-propeller fold lactonase family protein [Sedimentisphaerales bacterium]